MKRLNLEISAQELPCRFSTSILGPGWYLVPLPATWSSPHSSDSSPRASRRQRCLLLSTHWIASPSPSEASHHAGIKTKPWPLRTEQTVISLCMPHFLSKGTPPLPDGSCHRSGPSPPFPPPHPAAPTRLTQERRPDQATSDGSTHPPFRIFVEYLLLSWVILFIHICIYYLSSPLLVHPMEEWPCSLQQHPWHRAASDLYLLKGRRGEGRQGGREDKERRKGGGLPWWASGWLPVLNARGLGFDPWPGN